MKRVELDAWDRAAVERAREYLAEVEETGVGPMGEWELCRTIGGLQHHLGALLRMVDGGEER